MSRSEGLVFVEKIRSRLKHVMAIEGLSLQDGIAGGFENPRLIGDPHNWRKVRRTWLRMLRRRENYSGFFADGTLVAFKKEGYANAADRVPSHDDEPANDWHIFALIASDKLEESKRNYVLFALLNRSLNDPRSGKPRTVRIPIYDNDPLLQIALRLDFIAVGELEEVPGAPGLKQQYYCRPASIA